MSKKKKTKRTSLTLPTEKSIVARSAKDHIIMLYGPPGVGKTTFADDLAERVFFISTDRGTRGIKTMRQECHEWETYEKIIKALEKGAAENYDIVCIDHVTDVVNMADAHVCDALSIAGLGEAAYGKGWKDFKAAIWGSIQRLMAMDLGVVLIAHETIKTIETRSIKTDRMMPSMSKTAWDLLIPNCDLVAYCGFRTVRKGGKRQEIHTFETIPREDMYAKDRTLRNKPDGRSGKPYELLDGKKFIQTFSGGVGHGKKKKKERQRGRRARS